MQGLWYGCRGLGGLQASKQVAGSLLVARIGGLQASKEASGLTAGGKNWCGGLPASKHCWCKQVASLLVARSKEFSMSN